MGQAREGTCKVPEKTGGDETGGWLHSRQEGNGMLMKLLLFSRLP